ncbi:MAG: protein jag [Xylanivirga thermophila]|uniref:RNA-binding cell elongation regulator Jag/EloR n=1 Tax=Xylanivirga thermophila TaxID=2496273 RepID=UPI00101DC9CF|nr:RNA-binding cell elongation regulator Jag/EloR [Xylanivirga thermophila]
MRSVEATGKSVDEAILMAVAQLGVQRDMLDIEVLEEPTKGVLGIFGRKDARICATVKRTAADFCKDFLNGLLDNMNIEANISTRETDREIYIEITGEDMGILIGYRGETLDALQYLVSLAVNKEIKEYKRIVLDTEGYRNKREETLKRLAKKLAYKVQKSKKDIVLEPMNPYERRIIHSTLQNHPYITTYSQGDEPYRRVVIALK